MRISKLTDYELTEDEVKEAIVRYMIKERPELRGIIGQDNVRFYEDYSTIIVKVQGVEQH